MTSERKIELVLRSRSTLEGAGVRLKRVFGFNEVHLPLFFRSRGFAVEPETFGIVLNGFPPWRGAPGNICKNPANQ